MKKLLQRGTLALSLTVAIGYGVWIQGPTERQTHIVEQAIEHTIERASERSQANDDPALNAYLSPTFGPFWSDPNPVLGESAITETIGDMARSYSGFDAPSRLDGEEARKARQDFERVLPELKAELGKPLFADPDQPSYNSGPNAMAFSLTMRALAAYSEQVGRESRWAESVDILTRALNWSGKVQKDLYTEFAVRGAQLQLLETIGSFSDRELSPDQWETLALALYGAVGSEEQLLQVFQRETLLGNRLFDELPSGAHDSALYELGLGERVLLKFPGMLSREKRIYNNRMAEQLHALEKGESSSTPGHTVSNSIKGESGSLSSLIAPNLNGARPFLQGSKKALYVASVAAKLRAYKSKHGSLPLSLTGLGLEEHWLLKQMTYDSENAQLKAALTADEQVRLSKVLKDHSWVKLENAELVVGL